jgi:hypothetical protein
MGRGMLRALHAGSARAKNDLLGQIRCPPATDPRVPDCSNARVTAAADQSPMVLIASNGQTGGLLRRHQLPGRGVRSVNCWAWLWHGAGTSLPRIASELGRHCPHTDLWEVVVEMSEPEAQPKCVTAEITQRGHPLRTGDRGDTSLSTRARLPKRLYVIGCGPDAPPRGQS